MTEYDKRQWLCRYRDARGQIVKLSERRARARAYGEKMTVSFNQGGGTGAADRVQLAVERVAEIEAEMGELRDNLPTWEAEVARAIRQIENPVHQNIMRYFYIECLSWADTAELSGYSNRYIRGLHKKIVEGMPL